MERKYMNKNVRILIGTPTFDRRVDIEVVKGILKLEREGYDIDICFPVSSHISRNRNYIVHQALKEGHDYVFFWDSDLGLEEGFMDKLMNASYDFEAKIAVGCYKIKDKESKYVLGKRKGDLYENLTKCDIIQEVDAGGTGCMLIHKSVFDLIEDPWFTIVDGKNLETMPEDFEFCRKAKEKGVKIVAVPTFTTNHYGHGVWNHLLDN